MTTSPCMRMFPACSATAWWRVPGTFTMIVDTGPGPSTLRRLRQRLETLPEREGARLVRPLRHHAHGLRPHRRRRCTPGGRWAALRGRPRVQRPQAGRDARDRPGRRRVRHPETPQPPAQPSVRRRPSRRPPGGNPCHGGSRRGCPQVTLLSPGLPQLEALATQWPEVVRRCAAGEPDSASADALRGGSRLDRHRTDSNGSPRSRTTRTTSIPNASSIALLVEHRRRSLLLTGDGVSSVYGQALASLMLAVARHARCWTS